MIRVHFPTDQFRTMKKKDGSGSFYIQTGYVFELDEQGNERAYPTPADFFLNRDDRGNPLSYRAGHYFVSPFQLTVRDGRLQLSGFAPLLPLSQLQDTLKAALARAQPHLQIKAAA